MNMCSHSVYPPYPLAPSPVPSPLCMYNKRQLHQESHSSKHVCERPPLPGTDREGFNLKAQTFKAWVGGTVRRHEMNVRLLISSVALLNKQLKLEDKKKLTKKTPHVSTPANRYSTGCCVRLWRKSRAMSWIPALRPAPCRDGKVRLKRAESKGRPDQWRAEKRTSCPCGPKEPDAAELYGSFLPLLHLPGFLEAIDNQHGDEKRRPTTTQPIIDHQGQSSY